MNFEVALGMALPTILVFSGVSADSLGTIRPETTSLSRSHAKRRKSDSGSVATGVDDGLWQQWIESVSCFEGTIFRLVETRRCVECWKARYIDASGHLRLELTLGGIDRLKWRAFVEPPPDPGPLRDRLDGFAVFCGFSWMPSSKTLTS